MSKGALFEIKAASSAEGERKEKETKGETHVAGPSSRSDLLYLNTSLVQSYSYDIPTVYIYF